MLEERKSHTVVRTYKGPTNKEQITIFRKNYWEEILRKIFCQGKYCRFFISTGYF